jgi:regulator of cell morphogenesis and NO signaling
MTITANQTPADIIKFYPQASDVFKEYRIDFCCGGDRPLSEVFTKKQLNDEEVLSILNKGYEQWLSRGNQQKDWDVASLTEIIEHIQAVHHHFLREELPALSPLVTKIFRVHGGRHPHLKEVYRLFHELQMELEEHTLKEDEEVFPLIIKYEENKESSLLVKIHELEDEHDKAGQLLKELRNVTNDFTLPEGACNTYRITYERLKGLEEDTFTHIHLENHILFPRL